jgi:O-antigen/teichoic acid export membrane protein
MRRGIVDKMDYKRIFRDGIHIFAGKVGTAVISFINMMILARIFTVEQMGKYSLFLMIVSLALIVGLNWSDSSVIRHGREEFVKHKKINQSFWARMYLFLPIIIIFSALFIIFKNQIMTYISIDHKLILILIIMFILNGMVNFIISIYQSINQMKKSAYVLFYQKIFYLVFLALIFFNIFKSSITITLTTLNISFFLIIILNLRTFDFRKILPYKFNKKHFKKIWIYCWPQLIGFPGLYVVNYIDLFVIKKYMALSDVGIYNLAYSIFTNITMFIMIIYTVCMPLIVEYRTTKKFHMIRNHFKMAPFFVIAWIILVFAGLLLSKHLVPLLFSSKYVDSVAPFNILLVGSIFYFVSIYLLPISNAFDLVLYAQIINLIKAGVNIVGDLILVPKFGIIGAAYGTAIAYLVAMCLSIMLMIIKRKKILGETPG